MTSLSVPSFTATIYVGAKDLATGAVVSYETLIAELQTYVNTVGAGTPAGCLTVTPTQYIYVGGREEGYAIGFINYPRFPAPPADIKSSALKLARWLVTLLRQCRASVVLPEETIMITTEEAVPKVDV